MVIKMKILEKLMSNIIPYERISLIGLEKNVGKTTVLNALIKAFAQRPDFQPLALTSIGRDGESVDVVTKTDKPRIYIQAGTLIATAAGLLPFCDITKEILKTTGMFTPLGEIVVVRALSDGYVQLGGASIGSQTAEVCDYFKTLGAGKILVDGAISRKTLSAPAVTDATILCTGAAVGPNMADVAAQTVHAVNMLTIPAAEDYMLKNLSDDVPQNDKIAKIAPGVLYIQGAVSDSFILDRIMSDRDLKNASVVVEDATKLFIKAGTAEKLRIRGVRLYARRKINVLAVTINPVSPRGYRFDKNAFLAVLREKVQIPVYNVKDEMI